MGVRVKDRGESESHFVMRWIGVYAPRESGQTSTGSFITRELDQSSKEEKQMTAEVNLAGASFHSEIEWHAIDWRKAHRTVRRLQVRMVKAIQAGRWGKVKALQHLLTHSFSAKALAVKRVTENQGKKTPGIDNEVWDRPEKKAQAIQSLRQHGYRAQPLRRVYIPKGDGSKVRPLGIPTMKDRAMQTLYKFALDPIAETGADPNSYGFREGRSTADAIGQCFIILSRKQAAQWILEADIQSCFDQISHQWLLDNIPMDKKILSLWLKAGIFDRYIFQETKAGTPQGSPISPVLANMTLDGLEQRLAQQFPKTLSTGKHRKLNTVRFADDFVVTASSKIFLQQEVQPVIEQFLHDRGLSLSPEKTTITHIDEGFDFLGQNVRKYNGKLLIQPANKNVKGLLKKVRTVIKANPTATAGQLITQLNPIIRGWANYHRHVVSKKTFSRIDNLIWQKLWRWAKRRHQNKTNDWIKQKYFGPLQGGQRWQFFGEVIDEHNRSHQILIHLAAQTPIKRHIKIRYQANPYDPQWEPYFEKRLDAKTRDDLSSYQPLLHLWQSQQGRCPVCHLKITRETGWNRHHIVWRVHGGKDTFENLVLLHPNCHRQLHSQGISVVKPRPSLGV
jgi:RNA-directed DNA polymerase